MRPFRVRLSIYLAARLAFAFAQNSLAQPPAPHPAPHPFPVTIVGIEITSINPTQLVAGQGAAIGYSLSLGGVAPKPITGVLAASFQGVALQQTGTASSSPITLQPHMAVTGTFVIPAPAAGQGELVLSFLPPPPAGCTGSPINIARCRLIPIASVSRQLNVIQPTVLVRIAGTSYSDVKHADSGDRTTSSNGYQCVLHDPGCGWWGDSGTDKFFNQKALPAGAALVGTPVFTQYWPLGIDSGNQGAWTWLNSSGTYYAHLNTSDLSHPTVTWNNTCYGPFSSKNLNYSISFIVSMPKGTDLGEPTFDPASTPNSPCLPSGYSASPVGASPPPVTPLLLYLVRTSNYFSGTFGSTASGTIQTVTNGENFPIELLKPSNYPGNCGGAGNVLLSAHQATTSAQLTSLFGSANVSYPRTFQACVTDTTLAATQQSIGIVITYTPSAP